MKKIASGKPTKIAATETIHLTMSIGFGKGEYPRHIVQRIAPWILHLADADGQVNTPINRHTVPKIADFYKRVRTLATLLEYSAPDVEDDDPESQPTQPLDEGGEPIDEASQDAINAIEDDQNESLSPYSSGTSEHPLYEQVCRIRQECIDTITAKARELCDKIKTGDKQLSALTTFYLKLTEKQQAPYPYDPINMAIRQALLDAIQWRPSAADLSALETQRSDFLNTPTSEGTPLLIHWIRQYSNADSDESAQLALKEIQWIIENGAYINCRDRQTGNTPLHECLLAFQRHDTAMVKTVTTHATDMAHTIFSLLKQGACASMPNHEGITPCSSATSLSLDYKEQDIQHIMTHSFGADSTYLSDTERSHKVSKLSEKKIRETFEQCKQGDIQFLKTVLGCPELLHAKHEGQTLLHVIIEEQPEIGRSYLEVRENTIYIQEYKRLQPKEVAPGVTKERFVPADAEVGRTTARGAQHVHRKSVLHILLRLGANPNFPDSAGHTPTHLACAHGATPLITPLLQQGGDLAYPTPTGLTGLHLLAARGHIRSLAIIKKAMTQANSNRWDALCQAPTIKHQTPAHFAAYGSSCEGEAYALVHGADTTDHKGLFPKDYAKLSGGPQFTHLMEQSLSLELDSQPFESAASGGKDATVSFAGPAEQKAWPIKKRGSSRQEQQDGADTRTLATLFKTIYCEFRQTLKRRRANASEAPHGDPGNPRRDGKAKKV